MRKEFYLLPVLLVLILSGCDSEGSEVSITGQATLPTIVEVTGTSPISAPSATPFVSLTPSLPPPTATPPPYFTPLPTQTPIPTNTPVPWGTELISTLNASSLVQRTMWGLGSIISSELSSNGRVLILRTPQGIYIYQAEDMQLVRFLPEGREYFLTPKGDLLFTRFPNGSIQIIDLPNGQHRHTLDPIAALTPRMKDDVYAQPPALRSTREAIYFEMVTTLTAVAISQDASQVAIGFGQGYMAAYDSLAALGIWDLNTGNLIIQLQTNIVKNISDLVFSPGDKMLLSGGNSGEIAVWQLSDGQLLWRQPNIGHIVGQPFSQDSSMLVLQIDTDDTSDVLSWVSVRDSRYGREQGSQLVGKVASSAISADNTRLLTTWWDTVSIWTIPNLQLVDTIRTDMDWPAASFSEDGNMILLNGGQKAYRVSDLSLDQTYPQPALQALPTVDMNALWQLGFISDPIGLRYPKPDQALVWGVLSDHEVWVWNLANNIFTPYNFGDPFMALPDLSYDGDRLAACTSAGLIVITLEDSNLSNLGRCRASGVARFSVDGSLIFRTDGQLVEVLDSQTGEILHSLHWHKYNVESLAVTQDGAYLISTSEFQFQLGREVIWWQLDPLTRIWDWWVNVYPEEYIYTAVFQQDGRVLHTALGGLRSWRLGDGIQHHLDSNRINSLTISPDQGLLAAGDLFGIIHLWSLEDWQEVATLTGHLDVIDALLFSPDGTSLLSTSQDGTIRLWGLP